MGRKSRKKNFNDIDPHLLSYLQNQHEDELSEIPTQRDDRYGDVLDDIIEFKLWCEENMLPYMTERDAVTTMLVDVMYKK